MVVRKSRFAKPFEKIQVSIPYDKGMDPYSGLFDLCEKKGVLVKEGNRYAYTATDGTIFKDFRKNYNPDIYNKIMKEWKEDSSIPVGVDEPISVE